MLIASQKTIEIDYKNKNWKISQMLRNEINRKLGF